MGDVRWVGRQKTRAQIGTITINTASTGGTITVTVGGVRTVVITPTTSNTTTTAAELAAACEASTEPEFTEIAWTSALAVLTFTGPDDGTPVTVAKTDGGSNATTLALNATAPLSPNDVGDVLNWDTGVLPTTGDLPVAEDTDVPMKWNLDAIADAIATFTRRSTYTGTIGLPDVNAKGYREYRKTHLELNCVSILIEQPQSDGAGQVRIKSTTSSAATVNVVGSGGGAQVGSEALEIHGTPASSVLNVTGGSVAVAPLASQSGTLTSLTARNATVRVGPGVTWTTPTLTGTTAELKSGWSGVLTVNGGEVTTLGAAGIVSSGTVVVESGTLVWRSTGGMGASPIIGGGGKIDLSQAPSSVASSGTVQMYQGSALDDSAGAGSLAGLAFKTVRCGLNEVTVLTAPNKTFTLS